MVTHLHAQLGKVTHIDASDVIIANPDGFPEPTPFLQLARLGIDVDVMEFIRHRAVVIPAITLERPQIAAVATADGRDNYSFKFGEPSTADSSKPADPAASPKIGKLQITDGQAHVVIPKLKTDALVQVATQDIKIVASAKGTYAGQPVTGQLVGGALLSLRDTTQPYPIDLHLENGLTKASLVGTVEDPVKFAGANIRLALSGPDMALLLPLTGIALPKTPSYSINGQLDYADRHIQFRDFAGTLGSSDIGGTITVDPRAQRPDVTADLHSRRMDLEDLGGFIGSEPGRVGAPNQSPAQRQALVKAEASPQLIPNTPINLDKLRAADVHVKYHAAKVLGRSVPFDTFDVAADIVDGRITLHPLQLGVGTGHIVATIDLAPQRGDQIHAKADVKAQRLDVSRLMASTHAFEGAGRLGGQAAIDTTGNSLASMLKAGNGSLDLYMSGGNLSALLVDLSGLHFGKALLSALGIPTQAKVDCLVGQFTLQRGVLTTRTMVLDTSEAIVNGAGTVDVGREQVNYRLKTDSKHFTIGSLPAPIGITGPFKNLSIGPDLASIGARGGAAVGLGFLFPPLALLPTIQLGVGEDNRCNRVLGRAG